MSLIQQRIAQFRKMANDDPEEMLGHYRLGQALMEDGQLDEAVASFRRALELDPQFAKGFQLLGTCLVKLGKRDEAIGLLRKGYTVADNQGANIPRDEIGKLLTQQGEALPQSSRPQAAASVPQGGFRCQRPGCVAGGYGQQLPRPPMNDELGQRVYESVCAACWDYWLRVLSIKVINEMRLDLGDERHVETYDQIMREYLGLS
jgi:tetratricopeptide (TPR) repeat protein